MPDRTRPPRIYDIDRLSLPPTELIHLDNGIPVHVINMGTQDVLKLEVLFRAGRPVEHKRLVARTTLRQLREGTQKQAASEIAEALDFYGSSLSTPFDLDTANLKLYSLSKHFDKVLPVVAGLLSEPAFPEEELRKYITRNQQRLQVDLKKNDVVAYRQITEYIFGEAHPYGYNSSAETYADLRREDLLRHFRSYYTSGNCLMILSGRISDRLLQMLNDQLGQAIPEGPASGANPRSSAAQPQRVRTRLPDTVQSAIRVGRRLFTRHHPDYQGLNILVTVLGGYFGSRLMANIREEKGYTYNIFSMLDAMVYDGCLYIGTEVGNEFVEETLREIYRELRRLQEQPIDAEELEMVRNYLLGNFLTMLDGPFHVSDLIKTLAVDELPFDFFEQSVDTVRRISARELQTLAQRYFNSEDMWEVVVGD